MEPVTVWWAARNDARPGLIGLLDPAERGRRGRYLREADRDRFTLGVAITRLVAGARLGIPAERVPLTRACADCDQPHGPPVIAGGPALLPADPAATHLSVSQPSVPHLSVSHSGDLVAVAVSPYGPLGVDVEEDSGRIGDDIAGHLLAPGEDAGGPAGLLAYWTRKEALLKATGDGLRVPMGDLRVSAPDEPPRLLSWEGRPGLDGRIAMHGLAPRTGYAACLALLDHPDEVPVQERSAAGMLAEGVLRQ
ncbi:4'-phosphopantetheinyl transferase family protein [Actinomadura sp. 9N407]|uniref:4'-phosphopantetheinyl transferase family protein n=1 Tax=Actinomadura sp. 9N407 TaxID=3375154 RepID=UPI0037964546